MDRCHCSTVALVAAALNVAVAPAATVWVAGSVVTTGGRSTVSRAALVVVLPAMSVNTSRYRLPSIAAVTGLRLSDDPVLGTSDHVAPLSLDTCHCDALTP